MNNSIIRASLVCALLACASPAFAVPATTYISTQPVTAATTLPTHEQGTANTAVVSPLPAGSNALGSVGVTALPALPTGANAIGSVGVTSLPSLPTGANTIGAISNQTIGTATTPNVSQQNKRGIILTSTPLGVGATFTSAWFDSAADGSQFVTSDSYSTGGVPFANNYVIQESDDSSNANFTINAAFSSFVGNNNLNAVSAPINHRYWRVVYGPVNTTAQSVLEITASLSNNLPATGLQDPGNGNFASIAQANNDAIPNYTYVLNSSSFNLGLNNVSGNWERQQDDPGSGVARVTLGGTSYKTYAGGATAALVVKASPGRLVKIANLNTAAQTVTLSCYDNASAASGTLIANIILGAGQIVDYSWPVTNGVTCISSAATLAGAGINISYE